MTHKSDHSEHETRPMSHENHDHSEHETHPMLHGNHEHAEHEMHRMDHSSSEHMHHDGGGMHAHHHGDFKKKFFTSLPLGLVVLVLSPMMDISLPFQFTFPYSDVIAAIFATILLMYGGKPFYQGAKMELKDKKPGMMALISLGLAVSYFYSMYAVIARYTTGTHIMDFFFEFASLILIMLLGHWIEMKALGQAGDARKSLAELVPKEAHVLTKEDAVETRPVSELIVGDRVRVQAGENIPADGIILQGTSRVNEALLTGESKPVERSKGDEVIGGSTNGEGSLIVEVKETGDTSFVSQVEKLIQQAQSNPSRAENTAQKIAGWLFYIAIASAAAAFVFWLIATDLPTATRFAVTTLVIACPHALGLAIPLVVARSTSLGAKRGLLVKDRETLELARKADVMILDKTGTLTTGKFEVLTVKSLDSAVTEQDILAKMAGIESGSSHPIAQSIIRYAKEQDVHPTSFDSIENISGSGLKGSSEGNEYRLISQKAFGKTLSFSAPEGSTVSILTKEGQAIGTVALGDQLKESSRDLIRSLEKSGIHPLMATGDNEQAAKGVAKELGMDYRAGQSPEDKYRLVESLKNEGKIVIMVGDGVNDAPSLALADVGVAVGAGTQVALDSADIILTKSDPGDIQSFIELAKKTTRKMNENLLWGAGYNFIAIPLAAGVLSFAGIILTPAVGAILMSVSTVVVALNAMTLK